VNLAQAVDYLKYRHNDPSSGYWDATQDLYPAISSRCSIIAAIFGLIDNVDVSITTVAGTQAYTLPTEFISVRSVYRDGVMLQNLTEREMAEESMEGVFPQGLTHGYSIFDGEIVFVPTPNDAYDITIIGDKIHPYISAGGTIDIPEALHFAMLDGVLADMYTKYQNVQMATFYENKWNFHMKETFPIYKLRMRQGSKFSVLRDSDTSPGTGHGLI
jgi:hypothetical protein